MERANKTYGFTIAVKELKETVPNIFRYASAYKRKNNIKSTGLWEMFLEPKPEQPKSLAKDDPKYKAPLPEEILRTEPGHGRLPDIDPESMDGETYNMCHFWSNFEIARLDWFRSKEYEDFFTMMDRSGGFWMERVGFPWATSGRDLLTTCSGVMLLFTPWLQALCSAPKTSTTSETSAIVIQQYNTVRQTRPLVKCHERSTWRQRHWTRRSGKRKTITLNLGIPKRKMALVVDVSVIMILLM